MEHSTIEQQGALETRAAFTIEAKALARATKFLRMRIAAKPRRHESEKEAIAAASVRITAHPCGSVTLEACNAGYLGAAIEIVADVLEPGAFATSADVLDGMAQKAAKAREAITIQDEGERATIKAGRSRFNLPRRNAQILDDHPIGATEGALSAEFSLPLAQFCADIKALQPAIGTEYRRENLHCIALQRRELAGQERLVMLATDGKAAAIASRPLPVGTGGLGDHTIPSNAVPALIGLAKLADAETVRVRIVKGENCEALEFSAGNVTISTIGGIGAFPDVMRALEGAMSEDGEGQAPLFPELLPGAPTGDMERIEKKAPGAIAWEQRGSIMIGGTDDPGLFFGAMRMERDNSAGKDGLSYRGHDGETGEIIGPDGVTYPVPFNSSTRKIGLTAKQVRELIGESCFETLEFTGVDGKVRHVARWLWDDGCKSYSTVQPDGRCFAQHKTPGQWEWTSEAETFTREEIEAALAGEASPEPQSEPAPIPAAETVEIAPSEPEIAPETAMEGEGEGDPIEAILARLEALETQVATLSAEKNASPIGEAQLLPTDDPRASAIRAARREVEDERAADAEQVQAKRSPAHERAIGRAWAERSARRAAQSGRDDAWQQRNEAVQEAGKYRHWWEKISADAAMLCNERDALQWKRRRAVLNARKLQKRLYGEHRLFDRANERRREVQNELDGARQHNSTLQGEIARLKRDMADPSQPERASDIARLMRERDEARNATAALQQRCERAEKARDTLADAVGSMGTRLANAESAVRRLASAA